MRFVFSVYITCIPAKATNVNPSEIQYQKLLLFCVFLLIRLNIVYTVKRSNMKK